MNNSWIGIDLDGTLAFFDHWRGVDHIGEPVPQMLQFVKHLLAEGKTIKIFTARVCSNSSDDVAQVKRLISDYTFKHFGVALDATAEKDFDMIMLYDDRCRQVETNTGRLLK